jgi:hypothetical protein
MEILYVDESGKSGLADPRQPYFVLAGLAVDEGDWRNIEAALNNATDAVVPIATRPPRWELHASEIIAKSGPFHSLSDVQRETLLDIQVDTITRYGLTIFVVLAKKSEYLQRFAAQRPDPADMAYEYMLERFAFYLERKSWKCGLVISDDQKGQEAAIRAKHSLYRRQGTSGRRINSILETTVFMPSHESPMLQLVDGVAYWANRRYKDPLLKSGSASHPRWVRLAKNLDRDRQDRVVGLKRIC